MAELQICKKTNPILKALGYNEILINQESLTQWL